MREPALSPWRLSAIGALIAGFLGLLLVRLAYLQVYQHEYYRELARAEHWKRETIPAPRGRLLDRSGQPLAQSVVFDDLLVDPRASGDPAALARRLAPLLGEPPDRLESVLAGRGPSPVLLKRALPAEVADQIRRLRLAGVSLTPAPRRLYPQGSLASQVLGVVGADHQGLSGLEAGLNHLLAGQPGELLAERDTGGEAIALGRQHYRPPVPGADVVLTLDPYIQRLAERELEAALERHRARSGTIVVLDPRTGAVLAMAARPTFDPADPKLFEPDRLGLLRVPAVTDSYEPGSVFKVFTMAAAIDAGAITPETPYYETGVFRYAGGVVRNAIFRPPHTATMTLALQRSSNVGAAIAATTLGAERFYQYIRAFGFGQPTGIELPGEAAGLVTPAGAPGWHPFNLATNAFGQGLTVTPLQLAAALAAIVNDGLYLQPHLVAEVRHPDGTVTRTTPRPVRQVIAPATARTLQRMLVSVVEFVDRGVPRAYRLPGYHLGGKTGTAEIPTPQGYTQDRTITSFIGFGPAEDPRFVIVVRLDEPQDSPWADVVAAPVFKALAQQLLLYYRIPPQEAVASG